MTSTARPTTRQGNPDYVKRLLLPEPPRYPLKSPRIVEDKPSGNVNAGSEMSFVSNVQGQARQDVLDSTLLAQLAANKAFPREEDPVDWYKKYREVLEIGCGWVISEFTFDRYQGKTETFTSQTVVFEILISMLQGDNKVVADKAIKALAALSKQGDGRATLFDSESRKASMGNFQVGHAAQEHGVVAMTLGAFYFSTEKSVDKVLWFEFTKEKTSFYKGTQVITLNQSAYATVRQAIIDKLGDRRKRYIDDIDIG